MDMTPMELLKRLHENRLDREELRKELRELEAEEELIRAKLLPLFDPEKTRNFLMMTGGGLQSAVLCNVYRGHFGAARQDYLSVVFTIPENPASLKWPEPEPLPILEAVPGEGDENEEAEAEAQAAEEYEAVAGEDVIRGRSFEMPDDPVELDEAS